MANLFPKWSNWLPLHVIVGGGLVATAATAAVTYYFTPKWTRMGYMPTQPVPFSHKIHVSQLGMDCRYCHSYVEVSEHSNVPSTQTCMNCHTQIKANSPRLAPVRESWKSGEPIAWIRIHRVPDYAYFNHSAHVNRGVSCVSCHGHINQMDVVWQDQPQSMSWCLDCHRAPENALRPVAEVTHLDWKPEDIGRTQRELGLELKAKWNVNPPVTCGGCHR
ncbi:MAG: cytochrome c3 family protein [Verrucomicrobia bacterium]|nr:cytochrome c3 family protein [Verrucomicrobiota bacterium]